LHYWLEPVSKYFTVRSTHLWTDLKIAVERHSPSNLTVPKRISRVEWEKLPKYRCAWLVEKCPRILKPVIAAKGASTKY
jgi:hypothetical protein